MTKTRTTTITARTTKEMRDAFHKKAKQHYPELTPSVVLRLIITDFIHNPTVKLGDLKNGNP